MISKTNSKWYGWIALLLIEINSVIEIDWES